MKNYLALLLGVLLVLGFAASAFAIHAEIPSETTAIVSTGGTQITIGGEVRVRGEFQQNTSDFNSSLADHKAYYDERVRLSLDAKVTPNTEGYIQLESTNEDNTNKSQDINFWGNYAGPNPVGSNSYATGTFIAGNAKHSSLSILQAWILHTGSGLLGVPAGVKVGHMPLSLGNGLFFDHTKYGDDALLFFVDPVQDFHVVGLTAKFREGSTIQNDDTTGYVLLFNYAPKDWSASFDATYVDDQRAFGVAYAAPVLPSANFPLHFLNFGLRANGNYAGFGWKIDGEYQTGSIKNGAPVFGGTGDADFKGWAGLAGASYKLDPVMLSLDFAIGSGEKDKSGNVDFFVTSLGADKHYTYVYEYRTVNACGQQYGGLCNTWYVKLSAQADLAKDVTSYLDLYYLGAVKHYNDQQILLPSGEKTTGTSKSIGFEADAKVNYKIDRNLNYWVEGGYLFAGNFFNTPFHDASNAYAIRHGIQLNF